MRKFQFRLERVLELRRYHEREWELKLAQVTGACELLKRAIRICSDNIFRSIDDRGIGAGAVDIGYFLDHELFVRRMKQEILAHEADLEIKNRERAEIHKKYIEVSRKRKVLERLKERREAEYYKRARIEEFNEADEVSTSALIRARLANQ